jgi:hypothetical protein
MDHRSIQIDAGLFHNKTGATRKPSARNTVQNKDRLAAGGRRNYKKRKKIRRANDLRANQRKLCFLCQKCGKTKSCERASPNKRGLDHPFKWYHLDDEMMRQNKAIERRCGSTKTNFALNGHALG